MSGRRIASLLAAQLDVKAAPPTEAAAAPPTEAELVTRLAKIRRIGRATGCGPSALAAAVIVQAIHDSRYGEEGTESDPAEASAWLESDGARWLDFLRPMEKGVSRLFASRIA